MSSADARAFPLTVFPARTKWAISEYRSEVFLLTVRARLRAGVNARDGLARRTVGDSSCANLLSFICCAQAVMSHELSPRGESGTIDKALGSDRLTTVLTTVLKVFIGMFQDAFGCHRCSCDQ
jgi:hypothetical protein